jgi:archaellum component FlaC
MHWIKTSIFLILNFFISSSLASSLDALDTLDTVNALQHNNEHGHEQLEIDTEFDNEFDNEFGMIQRQLNGTGESLNHVFTTLGLLGL